MGRDHTIFAMTNGWVKFVYDKVRKHQIVTVSSINPNIPKQNREQTNIKLIEMNSNDMKV